MSEEKAIRWRQRFENFDRSYSLLNKYANNQITNELERAGLIHFFEMSFELAWKLLKDYLEAEGFFVKSPRESIKKAFQIELIEDGHLWLEALAKRNLTTHTYDEHLSKKFVKEIINTYVPILKQLHDKLTEEL